MFTLFWIAFGADTKRHTGWYERQRQRHRTGTSRSHTSNINITERLAERVWRPKSQPPTQTFFGLVTQSSSTRDRNACKFLRLQRRRLPKSQFQLLHILYLSLWFPVFALVCVAGGIILPGILQHSSANTASYVGYPRSYLFTSAMVRLHQKGYRTSPICVAPRQRSAQRSAAPLPQKSRRIFVPAQSYPVQSQHSLRQEPIIRRKQLP